MNNKKIVAICACTAGMAHTYIARQKITNEAKKRGWDCKVETQGAAGIENVLTEHDLKSADVIILATDITIEHAERLEPFKNIIKVSTGEAVKNTVNIFNNAEQMSTKIVKDNIGTEIFRALNTGISKFLPVIIASGILFSIVLMTGDVTNNTILPSNQFFADLQQVAFYGFAMMVPVLAAYMAYSIGGNAALAPAFIMGYVVNNPIGVNNVSTGFIGAMIFGILIGYFVKWFKTIKVHPVIASIMRYDHSNRNAIDNGANLYLCFILPTGLVCKSHGCNLKRDVTSQCGIFRDWYWDIGSFRYGGTMQ